MYDPNYYDWNMPTGWRCPVCGKIWAPHVSFCSYCNAERKTFVSTTTDPQTIKVTPFDDAGWWDNFVKNTSADSAVQISKDGTISWTGSAPEIHLEDELSWRDWLDEMRATNWRHDHLKEDE